MPIHFRNPRDFKRLQSNLTREVWNPAYITRKIKSLEERVQKLTNWVCHIVKKFNIDLGEGGKE